jgi:hypothetical protein
VRAFAVLVAVSCFTVPERARAEGAPSPSASEERTAGDAEKQPSTGERALASAGAAVPGVVVHGTGHYIAGETTTANRLLVAEGVGLGLTLGGLTTLALTGASKYVAGPAAATMIFGVGLFGTSYLADVYGTVSPDPGAARRRTRPPPWLETELGYRHVADPIFDYEHFVVERVSVQAGAVRLAPWAWFSTDGTNARYGFDAGYRVLGAIPSINEHATTADRLDAVAGFVHHRFVTERFVRSSLEVAVDSRFDLRHVGRTLAGAFVEGALGYAFGRIDYDLVGTDVPSDFDDLLLARFGFGAVLRGASHPGSEARVYYDHRHDDFAAGLVVEGLGSGVIGHFGAEARWFVTPEWGVAAHAEVGAAFITGASVLFRQAGPAPGVSAAKEP